MSLTLYGSSVPEPAPGEPAPSSRRRYLIVLSTVIALILGGGSAAFLLLDGSPNINRTTPNGYAPPGDGATATDALSDQPSTSPSVSPTASPSHSPSPSRSPSAHPSTPGITPVTYRAPNGVLCPSVNFQPVLDMHFTTSADPTESQTAGYNYVDYGCRQPFGKVLAQVDALIFSDAKAASGYYVQQKATAPAGSDRFSGLGTDAYGYVSKTNSYILWVLDGNLTLGISLSAAGGTPVPGRLRDCEVAMAPGTLHNLVNKG